MTPIPSVPYTFRAAPIRTIDGDSIVCRLDFRAFRYGDLALRLLGVDTPEVVGATAEAGKAAKQFTADWLTRATLGDLKWPLVLETTLDRNDKYGRLLARVWRVNDGQELNQALLDGGHAAAYSGGTR